MSETTLITTSKAKKSRCRTGCLNCRKKHKKCDEHKPHCGLCTKRKERCAWPTTKTTITDNSFRIVKMSVDDAQTLDLNKYASTIEETLNSTSNNFQPQPQAFTPPKLHSFTPPKLHSFTPPKLHSFTPPYIENIVDPAEKSSSIELDPTPKSSSDSNLMSPFWDYTHLHRTFRDYMFTNVAASSTSKVDEILEADFKNILESPVPEFLNSKTPSKSLQDVLDQDLLDHSHLSSGNSSPDNESLSITDEERIQLYKVYLYEVAPWLDMFDEAHRHFGTTIPCLASKSSILRNAIFALASRQLEQIGKNPNSERTIKLYQDTLRILIPTVKKTLDTSIISACMLLGVFEMMSSSPKKWRHHLEGCAALFKMYGIHGFCDGLERGLFWCYARMDISSAVIGEQSTIIPSEYWLPYNCSIYDLKALFNLFGDKEDMYANYMVYLCSRVLNLVAGGKGDYEKEWMILWDEISDWHEDRPTLLKPLYTFNSSPFPGVIYVNGPAISANQLYHMAVILMTQNKPRLHKIVYLEHIRSPIWHAKQICAISQHNEHHGCWNNALQPLWIAGQLLSSEQEHEIVLNLLSKIESTTGWQMKFRAEDLKNHWKHENAIDS